MAATRTPDAMNGVRPTARRCADGSLFLAAVLFAHPALAQDAKDHATPTGLTIAILDLTDLPGYVPQRETEEAHPTWRTTFGSERETKAEIPSPSAVPLPQLAEADVVLLQGVDLSAPLRRYFPPVSWRLVILRRIVSAADSTGSETRRISLPPTTAIAVRARKDLRVAARDVTLRLEETQPGDQSTPPIGGATAIRLAYGAKSIWLASIVLPEACSKEDPPCPELRSLDAWRESRAKQGEASLVGGRIHTSRPVRQNENWVDQSPDCASHTIYSDLAWTRLPTNYDKDSKTGGTACISIIRLDH